jgi:hypothetical protein
MKRSHLVLAAMAVLALAAWRTSAAWPGARDPDPAPGGGNRSAEPPVPATEGADGRDARLPQPRPAGTVTISGAVIDAATDESVGGVEVVFRSDAGEETTTADDDGRYRIDVPAGSYRAFVRDETVLSVGYAERVRLPELLTADAADTPDEALMPVVVASADATGVDLTVTRGGVFRGKVIDRSGRPIANAVLRASSNRPRPTLGTDVAETGTDGVFELRLPAGTYDVEVSHPRFAGLARPDGAADPDGAERSARAQQLEIISGEVQTATLTLVAGCVIAGRVVGPAGRPAGEGAIEERWGGDGYSFVPGGRIAADGTFRWTTTEESEIQLRAWPWKSPPSPAQTFACRDGARYEHVVFALPDLAPDLDGVLVDRDGAPVALAYIDVDPLDGGSSQQERTDEHGRWSVFELPAGSYRVTAYAAGRGVVSATVNAPQTEVRLALGGTGRLAGRTPLLARGSFELLLVRCEGDEMRMRLPSERRLVTVTNHAFTVEDVPACDLQFVAVWRGRDSHISTVVPAGDVARVELDLGPRRKKLVRGTVTDDAGRPIEGVRVQATAEGEGAATAMTDDAGRYSLDTVAGASIGAHKWNDDERRGTAYAEVGLVDRDEETIDLTMTFPAEGPSYEE